MHFNLNPQKISSLINMLVAISILAASYFQWWDTKLIGDKMITRTWVKILFAVDIALLVFASCLLVLF